MKILPRRTSPRFKQVGRLCSQQYLFPAIIFLAASMLGLGWVVFATPGLAYSWEYEVYARDLDEVSALTSMALAGYM